MHICHSSGYDCLQSGKSITVNCVSVPLNTDQSIVQKCRKILAKMLFMSSPYPEVLVKGVFQDIRHLPVWPPLTHRPQYRPPRSTRLVFLLINIFVFTAFIPAHPATWWKRMACSKCSLFVELVLLPSSLLCFIPFSKSFGDKTDPVAGKIMSLIFTWG